MQKQGRFTETWRIVKVFEFIAVEMWDSNTKSFREICFAAIIANVTHAVLDRKSIILTILTLIIEIQPFGSWITLFFHPYLCKILYTIDMFLQTSKEQQPILAITLTSSSAYASSLVLTYSSLVVGTYNSRLKCGKGCYQQIFYKGRIILEIINSRDYSK